MYYVELDALSESRQTSSPIRRRASGLEPSQELVKRAGVWTSTEFM